jgi:YidC/Oxa1 family membrane protein insertase
MYIYIMNHGGFLFIQPLFDFVFNVLIVLYRATGENLGLALILIAILSRVIVIPFTRKQLKNVDKNKEFQKKYEAIKSKYKNNKERQTQELAKLQSQYLPGQLSGCLTLIIQLLLLIQINYVISNLLKYGAKAFNEVAYSFVGKFNPDYQFNLDFLGKLLNLGKSARDVGLTDFGKSWPYLLIAIFLVVTQYFSMKFFTGMTPKAQDKKKKSGKKGKNGEDVPSFSEVFQDTNKQMMMFFPLILGFFSLNYPSGLSLYFATTSLFVIIQQGLMKRKEIVATVREKYFISEAEKKTKETQNVKKDLVKGQPAKEEPVIVKKAKKKKAKKNRKSKK